MTLPTVAVHTTAMLTRLATTGLPVGQGRKPDGRDGTTLGGWQGTPGKSEFLAYLVLYTLNMRREGDNASQPGIRAVAIPSEIRSLCE